MLSLDFGALITRLIIFIIAFASLVGLGVWFFTKKDYIETNRIIKPVKILHTDGVKVDTIYRYYKTNGS